MNPKNFNDFTCILVILFFAGYFNLSPAQTDFWEATTNFTSSKINDISIFGDNFIFVATEGDGIFLSSDQGNIWTPINNGLPSLNVKTVECTNFLSNNIVFAGGNFDSLYKKSIAGSTWEADFYSLWIYRIIVSGLDIYIASNASQGMWRSTDNGQTWQQQADPLWGAHLISSVATNPTIFVGSLGGGVFRSYNYTTWEAVNNGLFNDIVYHLEADGNGNLYAGTEGGVFSSTSDGDSWTVGNNGLPNLFITGMAINSEDHIFVGTFNQGVARSTDQGSNWVVLNSGLTDLNITDLELNAGQRLFVGTSSGKVFRSTGVTDVNEKSGIPLDFSLSQNFPNPFNPTTNIVYNIPELSFVKLKVYDILGNEVASLVSEEQLAGSYSTDFIANNLSSGIYLYQLQAGSLIETKKMILLR